MHFIYISLIFLFPFTFAPSFLLRFYSHFPCARAGFKTNARRAINKWMEKLYYLRPRRHGDRWVTQITPEL